MLKLRVVTSGVLIVLCAYGVYIIDGEDVCINLIFRFTRDTQSLMLRFRFLHHICPGIFGARFTFHIISLKQPPNCINNEFQMKRYSLI